MEVNDIIKKLEAAGLKAKNSNGLACSINEEGCFIKGTYNGPVTFKDDEGKDRQSHKFTVANDGDGEALVGKDSKKPEPLKAGEYLVFGSGLMNHILGELGAGKTVGLIYNGKKPYTFTNEKGKKQTVKSHRYLPMV